MDAQRHSTPAAKKSVEIDNLLVLKAHASSAPALIRHHFATCVASWLLADQIDFQRFSEAKARNCW
jgi:hypothetical protein